MNGASKVIKIAREELGYLEKASNAQLDSKTANAGDKNFTKYARDIDAIPPFLQRGKAGVPVVHHVCGVGERAGVRCSRGEAAAEPAG